MARKFRVGDKVRIKKTLKTCPERAPNFKVGHIGKIIKYDWRYPGDQLNYYVKRRYTTSHTAYFSAAELELIERKSE